MSFSFVELLIDKLRKAIRDHLGATEQTRAIAWLILIRSPLHLLLGATVGLLPLFLIHVSNSDKASIQIFFSALWAAFIVFKEVQEEEHQPLYKTIADCASMVGGFAAVVWLVA